MQRSHRGNRWLVALLAAALAYTVSGFATAALAGAAQSTQLRSFWRFAGWLIPLITFAIHIWYDRLRLDNAATRVALHAASAVAVGAFILAAGGPVAHHWGERGSRLVWLSLVMWPTLLGIPAFVAALVAGSILGRVAASRKRAEIDGDVRPLDGRVP